MLELLWNADLASRLLLGTARYPFAGHPRRCGPGVEAREIVTVSLAPRNGRQPDGRRLLRTDPHARRQGPAQHRRLPLRQGSGA